MLVFLVIFLTFLR